MFIVTKTRKTTNISPDHPRLGWSGLPGGAVDHTGELTELWSQTGPSISRFVILTTSYITALPALVS